MRLIDADNVIKEQRRIMESLYGSSIAELKKHMDIDDDLSVPLHALEGYSRAKQFFYGLKGILEAAPTVDAVPVVRCEKCRKFKTYECPMAATAGYNDFCSYGEAKEDL